MARAKPTAKPTAKLVKSLIDLVEFLRGEGLDLKKTGKTWTALCPFHTEKSASFSVDPVKQLWHCFGCGAAGDVFSFIERKKGKSFPEALLELSPPALAPADDCALATSPSGGASEELPQSVMDRVVSVWQQALASAKKTQDYLESRGLWVPELLRSLGVGYSSGKLPQILPKDGATRDALTRRGILNDRGNEFLFNRIVVPIHDETGAVVNVYGRSLDPDAKASHLYLPGPRRGLFNPVGLRGAPSVILTESVFDALSLVVLGFTHTTASWGVNGFTASHLAALLREKVARVYCAYDTDPAGDQGADQLAHDLAGHGIEVLRVVLPSKDPNDFLKAGGTREEFQKLLDEARPIRVANSPATLKVEVSSTGEVQGATLSTAPATAPRTLRRGDRVYEVTLLPRRDDSVLRVRLRVRNGDRTFVDTVDLYADRPRARVATALARLWGGPMKRTQVETDLLSFVEEVEAWAAQPVVDASAPVVTMIPEDRADAMGLLTDPTLAERIRADIEQLGVVGEDRAKLLVYLVATSRKLQKPLSLAVVSRSGGGKSHMVQKVTELMPEEDHFGYSRVSGKALFHDDTDRLKHKLLTIEEAEGMEEATYALRVMQSSQVLRTLSTITDPTTGRHRAQENVVHGPVALVVTTTQELDFETVSRAFVISVDESREQTERIHQMQRQSRTLAGLGAKLHREEVTKRHQNAQRLIQSLAVVNPYAPQLTFPTGTLRLRREHEKYLTLIDAITLLFQYQRKHGVYGEGGGGEVPYVVTAPEDIDLANELIVESLRQAFDEVAQPTRELLGHVRRLVQQQADGAPWAEVSFTRRQLREATAWSDHPLREHLEKLVQLEYVQAVSGSNGREYVYSLTPDHRLALDGSGSVADEVRALGLKSGSELVDEP